MAREMKDSGIEWIGEIPKEWELVQLRRFVNINNGREITREISKDNPNAIGVYGSGGVFKYTDKMQYSGKAVMFGRKGTLGKPLYVDDSFWAVDTMYFLTYKNGLDERFNYYQLIVFDWELYITHTAIPSIVASQIVACHFPIPNRVEQNRIAFCLDTICTEINNVLEKTRKSIEEYKKLKQAVIAQAVTKGIRGDREMKDSGIEWNDKIPAEWDSMNPKALFRQRKDKAFEGEKQLTASQQHGIMFQSDYMELTGTKVVTVEKDFDILKHVEAGDFVISMRSFQGGLEYSELSGSISSAYVMLVPNLELVYPRFYRWLLKSEVYIRALQSTSNMVRDGQAMRYSNFSQVRLYTVPMEEQEEIAQYLDEKCKIIDNLITKKEQYLSEIENYKKSLIFEYVTGKKEVPQE